MPKQEVQAGKIIPVKEIKFPVSRKPWILLPSILGTIAILIIIVLFIYRHSQVKWAKEEGLSEIEQLYNETNFTAAFNLVKKVEKYIPEEPKFKELALGVIRKLTVLTNPSGADVYIREYSDCWGI